MKRYLKLLLIACATTTVAVSAHAQAYLDDPRYGATREEREQSALNINFFDEAINNKEYDRAAELLQQIVKTAPAVSENVYINAVRMYKNKYAAAKSVAERNIMADSVMTVWNWRIESFGDHATRGRAYMVPRKLYDFVELKPSDREGLKVLVMEAIELGGNDAGLDIVNLYFNALAEDYKADALETDVLMAEYERLDKLFENSNDPNKEEARKTFDAILIQSGAADCENLEKVMGPKIAANPGDVATLEKTFSLLNINNCMTPFHIDVAEKLYAVKPNAGVAMMLANVFTEKGDTENAVKYLQETISTETDPVMKSNLTLQLAGVEMAKRNFSGTANYARQAINLNPNNPAAYIILANAYTGGSGACADFEQQALFWLVYDTAAKGRELAQTAGESELAESAQTIMNQAAGNFPDRNACNLRDIAAGSGYTVNCGWISGRTTARPGN